MKNKLIILAFTFAIFAPYSLVHASIFEELVGAVRDLQKQVVTLVSSKIDLTKPSAAKISDSVKDWQTYTDSDLGFSVDFPSDWSTTTIFSVAPNYRGTVAFVRDSRQEFLKKILKPDSSSFDLALQDSAIFFRSGLADEMYIKPELYLGKISTSTRQVGSTTVVYILYSVKTDPEKFAGGSMEKIIFSNGSSTIVAEANYSSDVPAGLSKMTFDKMLLTFNFTGTNTLSTASTSPVSSTTTNSQITSSSTKESLNISTSTDQTAGAILGL